MSIIYQTGSTCEDCLQFGLQNYLKPFYINLEEQIVKCESSQCMFPYVRRPLLSNLTNCKPPSENTTCSIDEFIEQSWRQMDETSPKLEAEPQNHRNQIVKNEIVDFDFSAIFASHPIKTETKEKPLIYVKQERQEPKVLPVTIEPNVVKTSCKIEDSKPKAKLNRVTQVHHPKKARISRCFSNIKTSPKSLNAKKKPCEKIEPVLVIEPQSGKSMRPLDLIMRYVKSKQK